MKKILLIILAFSSVIVNAQYSTWLIKGISPDFDSVGYIPQSIGLTLNGLTDVNQSFASGTLGTDFNIVSLTNTHTFNFPNASSLNRGLLTSTDWSIFNGKQDLLISGTNIKTVNGNSLLGSGDIVISGGSSDNWGSQVVQTSSTLSGDGTSGNPLGVNTSSLLSSFWGSGGNTLTGGEFIGTTNAFDLIFRTSNLVRGRFTTGGNFYIGASTQTVVGTSYFGTNGFGGTSIAWDNQIAVANGADITLTVSSNSTIAYTSGSTLSTLRLPSATTVVGRIYSVINKSSATIRIDPSASETVDGALTLDLLANESIMIQCLNATSWEVVSDKRTSGTSSNPIITEYSTAGNFTYTIPAGAKYLEILAIGGGGGGASGSVQASGVVSRAGSGGGHGGISKMTYNLDDLGNPPSLALTVGAGGSGGTAVSTNSTNGTSGSGAGFTAVGIATVNDRILYVTGGGSGIVTGGGTAGSGLIVGSVGGTSSTTGGAGNNSASSTQHLFGSASASSGGGVTTALVGSAGGAGNIGFFSSFTASTSQGTAGSAGAAGGGNAGTVVGPALPNRPGNAGGGGGGNTTGNGGNGSAGTRGAGGGGGGATLNGFTSGAGGAGGTGYICITAFFN